MTDETLSISEIFTSWQGEGSLTGTASVFVRVAGCHLRCVFCDTPYAWDVGGGEMWGVSALAEEISRRAENPCFPEVASDFPPIPQPVPRISHVVITGGEPMLFPAVVPLCEMLKSQGLHITVETSASRFLPAACDLWSLSPKLANSVKFSSCGGVPDHPGLTATPPQEGNTTPSAAPPPLHRRGISAEILENFTRGGAYQLKFVVDAPADISEILAFLERFPFLRRESVFLMPQGITREEIFQKEPWLRELAEKYGFQLSPRAHLFWFRETRGV